MKTTRRGLFGMLAGLFAGFGAAKAAPVEPFGFLLIMTLERRGPYALVEKLTSENPPRWIPARWELVGAPVTGFEYYWEPEPKKAR